MCTVELTEVYSPALFNERSMQHGLSTGVAAAFETGCDLETKHDVTNAAMKCEADRRCW